MDIAFFMGMVLGVVLGIGFTIFFTNIVTQKVIAVLNTEYGNKTKKRLEDEEPADWWKTDGYDPRYKD